VSHGNNSVFILQGGCDAVKHFVYLTEDKLYYIRRAPGRSGGYYFLGFRSVAGLEGYIPDQVSILIFVLSLFSVLNGYGPGFLIRIAGAFFCGGLLELIRLISKGGIGMGDVKLMTACGFYLGIVPGIFVLMLSYMLAGLFCLPVLLLKKASLKTRIPMAPFFAAAMILMLFFEKPLLAWYFSLWNIFCIP
jgi:prepilin signal peptidase PulO-like enzyme (type II secretory pathway)